MPTLQPVSAVTNFPTPWVSVWEAAPAPTGFEATILAKSLNGPVPPTLDKGQLYPGWEFPMAHYPGVGARHNCHGHVPEGVDR